MKKKGKLFALAVLSVTVLAMFAGCTFYHGSFTVISTRNIDWSRSNEFVLGDSVEGRGIVHIILIFPTGFFPSISTAVDNALNQVPGAVALVDVSIRYFWWYIPHIYGQRGWVVEGAVLLDPQLALVNLDSTTYLVFHINENGDFIKEEVSEAKFMALADQSS